jgi:hypothetical protein
MPEHQSHTSWQLRARQTWRPVNGDHGKNRGAESQYVPAANEVTASEVLHERFRRRQADQDIRVEIATDTRFGRAFFDIPG